MTADIVSAIKAKVDPTAFDFNTAEGRTDFDNWLRSELRQIDDESLRAHAAGMLREWRQELWARPTEVSAPVPTTDEGRKADQAARRARWAREREELDRFRAALEQEFRTDQMPQLARERMWNKAWEDGHASGLPEVRSQYEDLAVIVHAALGTEAW